MAESFLCHLETCVCDLDGVKQRRQRDFSTHFLCKSLELPLYYFLYLCKRLESMFFMFRASDMTFKAYEEMEKAIGELPVKNWATVLRSLHYGLCAQMTCDF